MDNSIIISLISSTALIGSMILNWVQWKFSKKGTELNNYEKQLELLTKLQASKDQAYQQALENKDLEIQSLRKDLSDMKDKLERYSERLTTLQNAVNRLIGDGCKDPHCPARKPYTIEDLSDVLNTQEDK